MKKEEMLNEVLQSWKVPATHTKEESWNALQEKISKLESPAQVIPMYRRPLSWVAAAAVVLVAGALFFFAPEDMQTYTAEMQQEVALPDGSVAHLNNGSVIRFNDEWEDRHVELEGEAFFQVTKGEKFSVETAQGVVQVLGTSFNVYENESAYRVDCYTGKVSVTFEGDTRVITKGQSVKVRNGQLSEPFEIAEEQPNWMGSGFQYTNVDLSRVIADVEAQFDLEITVKGDINGQEFSGPLVVSSAQEALELIAKVMGMKFETSDTGTYELIVVADQDL